MGDCFYSRAQEEGPDEEEAEEALSLSDFPLHDHLTSSEATLGDFSHRHRRSSSQPQDFFEFFSDDFSSDDHAMCSADDIIISGKLVPFKEPHRSPPNPTRNNPFVQENQEEEEEEERNLQSKATMGLRSRSESSSNHLHSPKTELTRNSRSLDYRKLQRSSSPSVSNPLEKVNTNSTSSKSFRKPADVTLGKRATRPRWSVFMFGMARLPAEMELEDIKTRQLRRNPTANLFVPGERRGNLPVSRSKGSWKLLRALSCKDHTSVAVTSTSFACLPQSESFA